MKFIDEVGKKANNMVDIDTIVAGIQLKLPPELRVVYTTDRIKQELNAYIRRIIPGQKSGGSIKTMRKTNTETAKKANAKKTAKKATGKKTTGKKATAKKTVKKANAKKANAKKTVKKANR
jgi:hypothetical protein